MRRRSRRANNVTANYRAAWWWSNRHLQTIWPVFARRTKVITCRERLPTPDGDFVDLDWLDGPRGRPLVLVLHGLEGSSRSHYVAGVLATCAARDLAAVAFNFRSCSGEPNLRPRFYHSGETEDFEHALRHVLARAGDVPIGLLGVSLGGNVLLKWLGEQGEGAPREVRAAVAISVPFDLVRCARVLDRGFNRRVYTAHFLWSMRRKVRMMAERFPGFVDAERAWRARTFAEYDRVVTAPLFGFADEVDYWRRASSAPWLARIRRPTLLINARDDPFVPPDALESVDGLDSPWVRSELPEQGGHVGFLTGPPWRPTSWAERRALEFLQGELGGVPRDASITA